MTDLRHQLQVSLSHAYTLENELGGGGMSRVFVATETALNRRVVVKVLPAEMAGGVSADRFKREIQLAARLQHPNIVPLLSAGEAAGVPWYTMPFVEGESLRVKLQRGGELPVKHAVAILRDVARALDYAHAQGVAHRDIKPDNVLLSGDYALVTDFGVARALMAARSGSETLTGLGVAIGTPAYMSPEQAAGDTSDHRADVYAFGCMAYEILTGAPPFRDPSAQALFAAHATRTPVPLVELRPAVPPPLAQLVMRCLEKRPSDRPQSAREIIDGLDAVSTPIAGSATHVTSPTRARPWFLKRSMLAVEMAVVVLAVIAAWFTTRPPTNPVNSSVVAVTPFRVAGADASLRNLREGMLDLISAKLSGTPHAVDPRTILSGWRKRGGSETNDLTREQSLDLAASLGAGRLLEGEIVGTPDRLVMSASLVVAPGGASRATARVIGSQQALPLLVDSLMAELLVREVGESEVQARALAGIPFDAIQAFIAGQAAYRRGRYELAVEYFDRALDSDSAFALAAIQLNLADGWVGSGRGARGLRLALQQYDRLGTRERLLLNGSDPRALLGRARSVREVLENAERAVAASPDVPETWYFLGEALTHSGWIVARGDDPWRRAIAAFEHVLALDSSFAPAREHLPMLYAYEGDTTSAQRQLAVMDADSADFANLNRLLLGLVPDSGARRRFVDRLLAGGATNARFIPLSSVIAGMYFADAEHVLEQLKRAAITKADRTQLAKIEFAFALNLGQPRRAAAVATTAAVPPDLLLLSRVFWDADSGGVDAARDAAARAYEAPPSQHDNAWVSQVFALAQYELARGDTTHASRAIALLRGFQPPAGAPWQATRPRALAAILDAQVAAMANRQDAPRTLAVADSIVGEGTPGLYVTAVGALIVARLKEQQGDMRGAFDAIRRIPVPANYIGPLFHSTYRLEWARIAAGLGHRVDALTQYRWWLATHARAEASFQPQVAEVRTELARLEKTAQ